jgi:hypothetical protein
MKKISALFYDEKYQGAMIVALIIGLVTIIFFTMFVLK